MAAYKKETGANDKKWHCCQGMDAACHRLLFSNIATHMVYLNTQDTFRFIIARTSWSDRTILPFFNRKTIQS